MPINLPFQNSKSEKKDKEDVKSKEDVVFFDFPSDQESGTLNIKKKKIKKKIKKKFEEKKDKENKAIYRPFEDKKGKSAEEPVGKMNKKNSAINFILEEYSGALRVKILNKIAFLLMVIIFSFSMVFFLQIFLDLQRSEVERRQYELSAENERSRAEIINNLKHKKNSEEMNIKLAAVEYLLENHVYWSNLFEFLENKTLKSVYYTDFENEGTKKIILRAKTGSFENLSKQFEMFKFSPEVESVEIDSGTIVGDGDDKYVEFNISLIFRDDFFSKNWDLE